MSLYEDLPTPSTGDDPTLAKQGKDGGQAKSPNLKPRFMPSHMLRPAAQPLRRASHGSHAGLGTAASAAKAVLSSSGVSLTENTTVIELDTAAASTASTTDDAKSSEAAGADSGKAAAESDAPDPALNAIPELEKAYDPAVPNDYQAVINYKEKKRKEAELMLERQAKDEERKKALGTQDRNSSLKVTGEEAYKRRLEMSRGGGRGGGSAAVMPAWMKKAKMEQESQGQTSEDQPSVSTAGQADAVPAAAGRGRGAGRIMPQIGGGRGAPSQEGLSASGLGGAGLGSGGGSAAERMMQNMGWTKGQGLGKTQQGMASALQVENSGAGRGTIVSEAGGTNVMLLLNMVGPEEVDPDLQMEVAEECGKYGAVSQCIVHVIQRLPEDRCVRVYVEFERAESLQQALRVMHNRKFGGRIVSALPFDKERFDSRDFEPRQGEQ